MGRVYTPLFATCNECKFEVFFYSIAILPKAICNITTLGSECLELQPTTSMNLSSVQDIGMLIQVFIKINNFS